MSRESERPAEQQVAAAVREALTRSADDRLAAAARGRVAHAQGRARVLVVLALVAAVLLAALVATLTGGGDDASARPAPSGAAGGSGGAESLRRAAPAGLEPRAMITDRDLTGVVPAAGLVRAGVVRADDANDAGGRGGLPQAPPVRGGWCGDADLAGVPHPDTWWVARWVSAEGVPLGELRPAVTQQVLRFADERSARGYVEATAASPARCFAGAASPSASHEYARQGGWERGGSPVVVAAAPLVDDGASWSVRALGGRGTVVVELTLTTTAPTAERAGAQGNELLDVALPRAVAALGASPQPAADPSRDGGPA